MNELSAGRELDALIAEKVMGWEYAQSSPDPAKYFCKEYGNNAGWWYRPSMTPGVKHWGCATCSPPPEYSTDIAAAWEVVEKLAPDLYVTIEDERHNSERFVSCWFRGDLWDNPNAEYLAQAGTVPLAICRAALKAVASTP